MLAGPGSLRGVVCPMVLMSWKTWKLKRKAISSNDAEVQAVLEAADFVSCGLSSMVLDVIARLKMIRLSGPSVR